MPAPRGNQYARKGPTGRHITIWVSGADIERLERMLEQIGVPPLDQEVNSWARVVCRDALASGKFGVTAHALHPPTPESA